jgi:hypothetical protein
MLCSELTTKRDVALFPSRICHKAPGASGIGVRVTAGVVRVTQEQLICTIVLLEWKITPVSLTTLHGNCAYHNVSQR